MYAIEFETDIYGEFIRLPEFEKLKHRHVKVIVLTEEEFPEPVFEQEHSPEPRRRPAKVPPIRFTGDVIDTVPGSSWKAESWVI